MNKVLKEIKMDRREERGTKILQYKNGKMERKWHKNGSKIHQNVKREPKIEPKGKQRTKTHVAR